MARLEKTVFISYRRTNAPWALAIFQNLTQHGYDVFFDFEGIASGDFEGVILENVRARAHFLVLLTPSALERCGEPGDWFRREIEAALETQRNIIPLTLEGFDFGSPAASAQLTGKLQALQRYNALRVPTDYFSEAMERLRDKYLNIRVDMVPHPASISEGEAARAAQAAAGSAPPIQERELTAQKWLEQGLNATDGDEQLRCFNESIRLDPSYFGAYVERAMARKKMGDVDGALQDYGEAIRLRPDHYGAYVNRGLLRSDIGDLDGALRDYDEGIRLHADDAIAHRNRASSRWSMGDLAGALQDYSDTIRLNASDH
jgi:tetratricopeptide (TPR) repeat protein